MVVRQVKEFFGKMTRQQIIRLSVFFVLFVAVAVTLTLLLTRVQYTVIFPNMKEEDAAAMVQTLKDQGVDVKSTRKPGDIMSIAVPQDQAEDVRLQMVAEGHLKSGNTYDLYFGQSGISTTSAQQQQALIYQLQEDIAATLRTMEKVDDARVMLNIPKGSDYVLAENQSKASASVFLVLKSDALTKKEVRTIIELVAGAVKDLSPANVAISDSKMNSYRYEDETADAPDVVNFQYEQERRVREQLQAQIITLLTPVFGDGNVFASVSVKLNFDKTTQQSTVFAPPVKDSGNNGIAISLKELHEVIAGEGVVEGEPGIDPNGAAPSYPSTADGVDTPYERVEREVNYEVNETKTMIEQAQGSVRELTVSVIISADEEMEDYTEDVRAIVANAIGIKDPNNLITVRRMPIRTDTASADAAALSAKLASDRERNELIRLLIIVAAIIVVVLMIVLMVRNVAKRAVVQAVPAADDMDEEQARLDLTISDDGVTGSGIELPTAAKNHDRELIEQLIEKDPEAIAHLLRGWLSDDR